MSPSLFLLSIKGDIILISEKIYVRQGGSLHKDLSAVGK